MPWLFAEDVMPSTVILYLPGAIRTAEDVLAELELLAILLDETPLRLRRQTPS